MLEEKTRGIKLADLLTVQKELATNAWNLAKNLRKKTDPQFVRLIYSSINWQLSGYLDPAFPSPQTSIDVERMNSRKRLLARVGSGPRG